MCDLSVIILVGNEELHIKRCLDMLVPLHPQKIFVVESQIGDRTHEIVETWESENACTSISVNTIWHDWPGNQALQFNWALDNLPISTDWILRLDADEWLTPELIAEIQAKIPVIDKAIAGVVFKRRHYWMGRWVKRGTYPTRILRLCRIGRCRYADNMKMDEHFIVNGDSIEFEHDFVDESLVSLNEWKLKHREYAEREAQMVINGAVNKNKKIYYLFPPYFRSFAYFCIRYFFKGGFMDGIVGWQWHFWQGLWYRLLVDSCILRKKRRA